MFLSSRNPEARAPSGPVGVSPKEAEALLARILAFKKEGREKGWLS